MRSDPHDEPRPLWTLPVLIIYSLATAAGVLCAGYCLYVTVIGLLVFGLQFGLWLLAYGLPVAGYLAFLLRTLFSQKGRSAMYRPWRWLLALVLLPAVIWYTYNLYQMLRGF